MISGGGGHALLSFGPDPPSKSRPVLGLFSIISRLCFYTRLVDKLPAFVFGNGICQLLNIARIPTISGNVLL